MKIHLVTKTALSALMLTALSSAYGQTPETAAADTTTTPTVEFTISSRTIEMKPTEKRPLNIKDTERNPYAKRAPEEEEVVENGADTQENRIRMKLLSMPISGASQSERGIRLLVGNLVLEPGTTVPQVIPDQTEFLRVLAISEEEVKFGWLDIETGDLTGKTMQIAYDLDPVVRQVLPGQQPGMLLAEEPEMGILRVGEERKRLDKEYQKINPKNRISQSIYERAQ